jgi:hypothetical protein|tara:strand:- start:533 stop:745 length:213 start_codon:yes stop_codon:yes gene_type:complete
MLKPRETSHDFVLVALKEFLAAVVIIETCGTQLYSFQAPALRAGNGESRRRSLRERKGIRHFNNGKEVQQ